MYLVFVRFGFHLISIQEEFICILFTLGSIYCSGISPAGRVITTETCSFRNSTQTAVTNMTIKRMLENKIDVSYVSTYMLRSDRLEYK